MSVYGFYLIASRFTLKSSKKVLRFISLEFVHTEPKRTRNLKFSSIHVNVQKIFGEVCLFIPIGELTSTTENVHTCADICTDVSTCAGFYYNSLTADCLLLQEHIHCTETTADHEFVFEKQESEETDSFPIVSTHFVNVKLKKDL